MTFLIYNSFGFFSSYFMEAFLESIKTIAPNYLIESCTAEEKSNTGTTRVDLEFAPFHAERPGLSIYDPNKKLWKHISRIEDIYAIIIAELDFVKFEMGASAVGPNFEVQILDKIERESFVSCISGYYRYKIYFKNEIFENWKIYAGHKNIPNLNCTF